MKLEKGNEGVGIAGKKVNLRGKGVVFGALMMLLVAIVASCGVVAADDGGDLLTTVEGALSPNWEKVAFAPRGYDLYIADLDGSKREKIVQSESIIQEYVWSPTGNKIAYCNSDGLWVVNSDGSNNDRIADNPIISSLLWSPDGEKICYTDVNGNIYVITSDGSDNKHIGYHADVLLSWTSDEKILFLDYSGTVYKLSEDGRSEGHISLYSVIEKELGHTPSEIRDIIASADGNKIAFRCMGYSYAVNFDGSNLRELPCDGCLSPDFKRIAFESVESVWVDEIDDFVPRRSIWVVDSDGSNRKEIVDFGLLLPEPQPSSIPAPAVPSLITKFKVLQSGFCDQYGIGWSQDGSKIVYRKGTDLYVVNIGKAAPPTPTPTPTVVPTLTPSEDPFNYQGEYTLELNELRDEEKAALSCVMKYAKEYKVSPCLIMAVIRQESNFDASANGGADVGYMQVTYNAAKDGGYKGTEQEWQQEDGFDPDQNIEYGTKYLRALNDIFRKGQLLTEDLRATKVPDKTERLKFVLAAYNGGAGRIAIAQQICEDEGDNPEKWDDVKEYLEAAGATPEKAEIIKKYVEQVIEGRDFFDDQQRGYEFFLTIRVPEVGVPGFEAIFAIAGLLAVAYLLRRRK